MRLIDLTCNSCGAPLEVPESANFVKCNHCLKQLAVRRTDDVTFTEAINRLAEQSELFSNRIADLELQRQLDELEAEWQKAREPLLDRSGRIPTTRSAIGYVVIGIVLAIIAFFFRRTGGLVKKRRFIWATDEVGLHAAVPANLRFNGKVGILEGRAVRGIGVSIRGSPISIAVSV